MIYICFVGKIIDIEYSQVQLKVLPGGEYVKAVLIGDQSFELQKGDEGIFAGFMTHGEISLERIELRKLLDPLYQQDLILASELASIIPLVSDPFPKTFIDYSKYENQHAEIKEKST